jgi:hypothetical protein
MKTARLLVFSILVLTVVGPASAQISGWGFGAGSFDGEFGLQARRDIRLGGDISHINAQASVIFAGKTAFALDADYHFVIKSGKGRFYPLGGLHFVFNSNDAKFGVNAGGGLNFMLTDKLAGFGEIKYVFGGWDGWFITGGIYF